MAGRAICMTVEPKSDGSPWRLTLMLIRVGAGGSAGRDPTHSTKDLPLLFHIRPGAII